MTGWGEKWCLFVCSVLECFSVLLVRVLAGCLLEIVPFVRRICSSLWGTAMWLNLRTL